MISALALDETSPQSSLEEKFNEAKTAVKVALGRPVREDARFQEVLAKLRDKAITVKEIRGSDTLEVTVNWDDPEMTMRIANTVADVFIEQFQEFNRGRSKQNRTFLELQVELIAKELKDSEQALVKFQAENNIVSPEMLEKPSSEQETLEELLAEKRGFGLKLSGLLAEYEGKTALLDELQVSEDPKDGAFLMALRNPNSVLRTRMAQIDEAQLRMPAKVSSATKQLKSELSRLGANPELSPNELLFLSSESVESNSLIPELKMNSIELAVRINVYQETLLRLEERIDEASSEATLSSEVVPEQLREYMSLARDQRVSEELYTMLSKRLAAAQIDENTTLYDVRVFEPAQLPIAPIKPKPFMMTIVGVFMGFMLGTSLAFLKEYTDDSLRNAEEVERYLGLPVLAELPKVYLPKRAS